MRPMPMSTSHKANPLMIMKSGMSPKLNRVIVLMANSCAGLNPGKNLRNPNKHDPYGYSY